MDPIDKQDDPAIEEAEEAAEAAPVPGELTEDHHNAIRTLAIDLMDEDAQARREYYKRVKKVHCFYRGEQYVYWDVRRDAWLSPTTAQILASNQSFKFVTNIIRPNSLILIAALARSIPKTRFWPQSPQQEEDVNTADAASVIAEHVQRVNRMSKLQVEESSYLALDGMVAGHVRWIADEDRFGTREKPVIEMVEEETEPAGFQCPECSARLPAPGVCPTCGYTVDESFAAPPVITPTPQQTGTETIAAGQVVIDMVGALNIKIPAQAKELRNFGYLAHVSDLPVSKVKAVHVDVADKIGKGSEIGGMNDATERQDRRSLASGRRGAVTSGAENESLVTYHRIWLRPWTFLAIKDPKIRKDLQAMFPKGVRACFADDVFCEAVEDSMDDHWRIMHAGPGDGQYRDPLVYDLISLQERLNTLKNLGMETYQHGIPTLFIDRDVVNPKAYADSGNRPGSILPAHGRAGQALSQAFHETSPASMSRDAINEGRELMTEDAQFIGGAYPAMFGGGAINNETAAGYAMQRDQAMGRLGMVFQQQREFHAELLTLAVEETRRNMAPGDPMEVALLGEDGNFDTKQVQLEDLKGAYRAYPEADENFPESFSQRKDGLLRLVEANSPVIAPAFQSPSGMRVMWRDLGIADFKLPGEISRQRQYQEIQACLRGVPQPGPPVLDPAGMPVVGPDGLPVPGPMLSSVPVDEEYDDHATHFATVQEWVQSGAGAAAKIKNPGGYENVRAHGLMHKQIMDTQMAEQMAAQALVGGGAPAEPGAEAPPPAEGPPA